MSQEQGMKASHETSGREREALIRIEVSAANWLDRPTQGVSEAREMSLAVAVLSRIRSEARAALSPPCPNREREPTDEELSAVLIEATLDRSGLPQLYDNEARRGVRAIRAADDAVYLLTALLHHLDEINSPTGPFWSGAPDQEAARAYLRQRDAAADRAQLRGEA